MLEGETSTVASARAAAACAASLLMLCACDAGSEKETWKDILGTETKLYSQNDEEVIIRDFFQDRKGGFFLDVGSAHPKRNSTSYYLEGHLDWTGIAIDALPEYAPQFAEQRPGTKFFNYIVTDHEGTRDEFYRVTRAPGLSSTIKGRKWKRHTLRTQTILVPTITLNTLLDQQDVRRIDFLSMDIERGAPKALASFDIERFAPELVCIEAGAGVDYRSGLLQYFAEHEYRRIDRYLKHDWINWYFTPKD